MILTELLRLFGRYEGVMTVLHQEMLRAIYPPNKPGKLCQNILSTPPLNLLLAAAAACLLLALSLSEQIACGCSDGRCSV